MSTQMSRFNPVSDKIELTEVKAHTYTQTCKAIVLNRLKQTGNFILDTMVRGITCLMMLTVREQLKDWSSKESYRSSDASWSKQTRTHAGKEQSEKRVGKNG